MAVKQYTLSGDEATQAAARFIAVKQGGGTDDEAMAAAGAGVSLPEDIDDDCPF